MSGDSEAVFDAIDLKKHTARVIGSVGADDVVALPTLVGVSFIESGAVFSTTTVFSTSAGADAFLAVDSRQDKFAGTTFAEQYPGICRILQ